MSLPRFVSDAKTSRSHVTHPPHSVRMTAATDDFAVQREDDAIRKANRTASGVSKNDYQTLPAFSIWNPRGSLGKRLKARHRLRKAAKDVKKNLRKRRKRNHWNRFHVHSRRWLFGSRFFSYRSTWRSCDCVLVTFWNGFRWHFTEIFQLGGLSDGMSGREFSTRSGAGQLTK